MTETAPLRWVAPKTLELGVAMPSTTRLALDGYDWWHFRRLGAHVPELAQRLVEQPALVPIAFDLYGWLYKPTPTRRAGTFSALSDALLDELERTGAVSALRARTVLDEWATVTALPEVLEPLFEALGGGASETDAIRESCARAIERVAKTMELVDQVERLFRENDALGRHRGALASLPLARLLELAQQIRRDRALADVIELAGRLTFTLKRRFPRGGSGRGRDEARSVELGGELGSLVPSELALLRVPRLRRAVLARVIERRALCTAMKGPKTSGRGPVILVVDTSASMGVDRLKLAKAFALAVAMRCWETGRPFHVITFGAPGEIVETSFSSRDDFATRLEKCLRLGFGGGTDYDGPLLRVCALATEKPWSQADAFVVTDGHGKVSPDVRAKLGSTRARTDLEVLGVLVGGGAGLEGVADAIYEVDDRELTPAMLERMAARL